MSKEEKKNGSSGPDPLDSLKLIKDVVLPTALISAIAYFTGWSTNAAYYLYFGIYPSFIDKPVEEILSVAWVELATGTIAIAACFGAYRLLVDWLRPENLNESRLRQRVLVLFYLILVTSFVLGGASLYFLFLHGFRLRYLALSYLAIFLFWIAAVLGKQFDQSIKKGRAPHKSSRFFTIVFPDFHLYAAVAALALVFIVSRQGIWRGHTLAVRDLGPTSRLKDVILYSQEPLPMASTFEPTKELYIHDNLRLIDMNDDYFFILGRSVPISTTTPLTSPDIFIIPKNEDVALEIRR